MAMRCECVSLCVEEWSWGGVGIGGLCLGEGFRGNIYPLDSLFRPAPGVVAVSFALEPRYTAAIHPVVHTLLASLEKYDTGHAFRI